MTEFPRTPRTSIRRLPKRGSYDRDTVYSILDEGVLCHVGFAERDQPFVIPMAYARRGDEILLHGSIGSRLLRAVAAGTEIAIAVTHLDGIVVARSAFHSSMNYRSVIVFGRGREIEEPEERKQALDALVEHLIPGRNAEVRPMTDEEMRVTRVVSVPIGEAVAKIRTGPPIDDEADYQLPIWAGVLPVSMTAGAPLADPRLGDSGVAVPASVRTMSTSFRAGGVGD
ncbi:MAG TPA: pyridoxamine 5'-phosphate oxidase family protein [Thermoanaerobaculia bacterium]|nr:pyridoxamine 5'-phosphate oxidase family protein [Thermoanaerobaculia bacterium]